MLGFLALVACVHGPKDGDGRSDTDTGDTDTETVDSDSHDSTIDTDTDSDTDTGSETDTDSLPDTGAPFSEDSGCPPDTSIDTQVDTGPIDTAGDGTRDWVSVEVTTSALCGFHTDGSAECWGDTDLPDWQPISGLTELPAGTYRSISMADEGLDYAPPEQQACGVLDDGTVTCWGLDDYGQADAPSGTFTEVAAAWTASLGVTATGNLVGWGDSRPYFGSDWAHVTAGAAAIAAIKTDGSIRGWLGSKGYDSFRFRSESAYSQVAMGGAGLCAIRNSGTLNCFVPLTFDCDGSAVSGGPPGRYTDVCVTGDAACALNTAGYPVCWGENYDGGLDAPARPFRNISCSDTLFCGVAFDGAIICWGSDLGYDVMPAP